MIRVRKAKALNDYRVRLTLTSGDVVERDLSAVLSGPAFAALRDDPAKFGAMTIEAGTLVWGNDADIDPDTLIWGGAAPRDPTARPPRFLKIESPHRLDA